MLVKFYILFFSPVQHIKILDRPDFNGKKRAINRLINFSVPKNSATLNVEMEA